jgi:N-acetylmuramoyl-L-alanine amidase
MNIQEKFLTVNKYSRSGYNRPDTKAVVVHWVENPGVGAEGIRDYFESLKRGIIMDGAPRYASTQYIVGLQGEIIQTMPDKEVAYHCGSAGKMDPVSKRFYTDKARGLFGAVYTTAPYSPNYATIGIELCHPDWTGKFLSQTLDSAAELVASIFKKYPTLDNPYTQIIRHYDVVGHKQCPRWFFQYPDEFFSFQNKVFALLP